MNIPIRKYVVSSFGRTFSVNVFTLLLSYCYHSYKDALSIKKGLPLSHFRILGSYVSVFE